MLDPKCALCTHTQTHTHTHIHTHKAWFRGAGKSCFREIYLDWRKLPWASLGRTMATCPIEWLSQGQLQSRKVFRTTLPLKILNGHDLHTRHSASHASRSAFALWSEWWKNTLNGMSVLKNTSEVDAVAHMYNPSYSGDGDWEDGGWRPFRTKS
jgi:hypothetical protein